MALSRREFQVLTERVAKLEAKIRQLEDMLKIFDVKIKPESLLRSLKHHEETEKQKHDRPI